MLLKFVHSENVQNVLNLIVYRKASAITVGKNSGKFVWPALLKL